ncbi:transcriptional regulator [Actinoplanes sp. NPDC051633]|uniref:transcriptional regulator n=1 Tax=Actinoplanes sp. NPDC051633 TaxID=3155670 RepID=UPI00344A4475
MANLETADMIAKTRRVSAEGLLEGRADLSQYPFQLLTIQTLRGAAVERIAYVASAAEFLMQYGWDLVNVVAIGNVDVACAVMRRRPPT